MKNRGLEPDIVTKFVFNQTVVVEIESDYEEAVWLKIYNTFDKEPEQRSVFLEPDEVDLFIAALKLYRDRINRR